MYVVCVFCLLFVVRCVCKCWCLVCYRRLCVVCCVLLFFVVSDLLVVCRVMSLDFHWSLRIDCCALTAVCCSLLVVCCVMRVVPCLLFVVYCFLFLVCVVC